MWSLKPLLPQPDIRRTAISGGLEAASLLQSLGLMREAGGLGAIFTLHHVRPHAQEPFEPSRHLEISPDFLEEAILRLKREGYIFIPLDAVPEWMASGGERRARFAAVTLDDGYRNNVQHALPVLARHGVPFTVFVTKGFSERSHGIWWETLAALLRDTAGLTFDFGAGDERLELATPRGKCLAFDRFAAFVHRGDEAEAVTGIDRLARRHGLEPLEIVRSLVMDRVELEALAGHPLASLGAHTLSHRALARLGGREAVEEMEASADYVATVTGRRPTAFAFPYGTVDAVSAREAELAAEAGFKIGVTTRPGVITSALSSRMTMLPRLSLNGYYQKPRYAAALASGIPTALMRRPG